MSKRSILCIAIVIFVCCGFLIISKPAIPYNNTEPKEQLISKKYSDSEIEEMIKKIDEGRYGKYGFIKEYDVECLRKSLLGYYAIFQKEDGKFVYVFLDEDFVPAANVSMIIDEFKTKEEFLNFLSTERSASDMVEFDSSTFFPFYGRRSSLHIVVEGYIAVDYYINNGTWYTGEVPSTEYYDNNEVLQSEGWSLPYILKIDRENQ